MGVRVLSSPSRWLSVSFSNPAAWTLSQAQSAEGVGGQTRQKPQDLVVRSGGRGMSPHPPGSREACQGWEGPVGLHRPRGSARPQGWALGRGVAPRRGVAWPVRSCRIIGGGDALVPRGRNSHTGGRCPGCGHPEITCPLGLTCLRPDGLMWQENSLRRPALVLEPWTSCDLASVLGPCQLSKDGVPSLQACLGQRPFSGWRWGRPLRGGGLGGTGGRGHWEGHRSRGQTFSV